MTDRILLIGKHGQVGQALQTTLAPFGTLMGWGKAELDLSNPSLIVSAVKTVAPTLIVNAAAYTAVDRAEQESTLAYCINGEAVEQLAIAAQTCGATLIHFSTDYVFNGQQNRPYHETDPTNPLGIYGQSKRAGEEAIQHHCDRHLILRTAWVYSASDKPNFVKTMLRLGQERSEVRVVYDQIGSPTWARDIATTIARLIPYLNGETYGIYHFTNSGIASWYDFAVAIFEEAHHLGWPLVLEQVTPITTAEYPTPAQRPAYSVLNCAKLSSLLGTPAPHWHQRLRQMLQELKRLQDQVSQE